MRKEACPDTFLAQVMAVLQDVVITAPVNHVFETGFFFGVFAKSKKGLGAAFYGPGSQCTFCLTGLHNTIIRHRCPETTVSTPVTTDRCKWEEDIF